MERGEPEIDLIYALAVTPDGNCFAARESGLYRSDDDGHRWRSAYDSLGLSAPLSTTTLALSPTFAQDRTIFAGVPGGVLRSTDGGHTWRALLLPEPPPLISALALSPAYEADGFVLATTFMRGVFYSTDRGETWWKGSYSLLDRHVLALALSPSLAQDRTVLIGTESGVFSSSNGGRSWDVADLPYVPVTSIAFAAHGSVHAGTDGDGMYTSLDKGVTWTRSTLENTLSISLILTPAERDLLVFAGATLYRSRDAGATWTSVQLTTTATAAVLLTPAMLLAGYDDGTISSIELQA